MTTKNKGRTLGELGEREFLRRFIPILNRHNRRSFVVPPGDDGAVLKNPAGTVLSIDALTEGTHFKLSWERRCRDWGGFSLPRGLGWKLLGSSLSDLAAMGGSRDRWAMIYLGAPGGLSYEFLKELYRGVREAAHRYHCALAGGDTVKAKDLTLVAAVGASLTTRPLTRGGARPGDLVCVAGTVGDAAMGLRVMQGKSGLRKPLASYFLRRFFGHEPLLEEGKILGSEKGVTALMDLSDPLDDCLNLMMEASQVGMEINVDSIPVSRPYRRSFPVGAELLGGGEDYSLLFTVRPERAPPLRRRLSFAVIGRVSRRKQGLSYRLNGRTSAPDSVFRHFG